jgi:hypothetical protein
MGAFYDILRLWNMTSGGPMMMLMPQALQIRVVYPHSSVLSAKVTRA